MRNNNSDYNSEAVKIANALKPMFKTWFDEWARSCVRVKKMTVSTAPSNGIVGVKDAFSDKEIFAKYTPSVANANVGDTVWCRWYFDNMQTLYASDMGNVSSADASFDNATINNDLSVYGDLFIGSTTLTEAALSKLLTSTSTTPTSAHTITQATVNTFGLSGATVTEVNAVVRLTSAASNGTVLLSGLPKAKFGTYYMAFCGGDANGTTYALKYGNQTNNAEIQSAQSIASGTTVRMHLVYLSE